ncbi:MAG: hypothetical protein KAU28_10835, partial [Phycisphaerae bacterium]|nr:hypothetical protein [Phycisphaerae bacterium]
GSTSPYLTDAFSKALSELNRKEDGDGAYKSKSAKEILDEAEKEDENWSDLKAEAKDLHGQEIERIEDILDESEEQAKESLEKASIVSDEDRERAEEALEKSIANAYVAVTERKKQFRKELIARFGKDIFESLLEYEKACFTNAIQAVRYGNLFGGIRNYRDTVEGRGIQPAAVASNPLAPMRRTDASPQDDPPGFAVWVLMGYHGIIWLIVQHWVYATILLLVTLAVAALFGGAVHRIAALHAARDEKISIVQALKFSVGKFLSFFTAPLIPIAIIMFIGLLLFLGGLVGGIPYVGEIIMGVLFFLAVIAGLLVAFLLVGLVAGVGLMYPTIAVEGSDSFDAISRSFSYVFARPWRAVFYGLVALVYGVITYMFVRLFAYLALAGTHFFVKWGVIGGGKMLSPDADKLDVMWTKPTFGSIFGPFSWDAMSGTQTLGAVLIGIWVYVVAGLVAAYLLSYLASSTTVIYCLLRRKVDATDLDDVYVEEAEEEPAAEAEAPAEAEEAAKEEGGEEKSE